MPLFRAGRCSGVVYPGVPSHGKIVGSVFIKRRPYGYRLRTVLVQGRQQQSTTGGGSRLPVGITIPHVFINERETLRV